LPRWACGAPGLFAARRASNNRTLATGHTMPAADLAPMSQQSYQPSLLNRIARVLLCLVFIHAVIGKLTGFAGVAGAIAAKGLPLAPLLLVAAMALMAVGSALVISGWKARLGAILLLLFLVPTTLLFHGDLADKLERIQLFKNLAIMGGLLLVADQDSRA
jgi:putative oxidoreductase